MNFTDMAAQAWRCGRGMTVAAAAMAFATTAFVPAAQAQERRLNLLKDERVIGHVFRGGGWDIGRGGQGEAKVSIANGNASRRQYASNRCHPERSEGPGRERVEWRISNDD